MRVWYRNNRSVVAGAAFVLPALAVIGVFFLYPALLSFRYSATNWNGISPDFDYVGWDNFRYVVQSPQFKQLIYNTLFLVGLYVPVLNLLSLLLAILIYDIRRFASAYKVIIYLPNIFSMVVVGVIWKVIYNPVFGPVALVLTKLGKENWAQDWLGQTSTVMPALSLSIVWYALGFYLMIYLGGLSTISQDIYESAELDGITWFQKLRYLTFPLLSHAITINVVVSAIGILTIFDLPFVLTGGGPGYASQTMAISVYIYAFKSMQQGSAMALAVILTLVTTVIALGLLRLMNRKGGAYE